jgi:hypothetical protein
VGLDDCSSRWASGGDASGELPEEFFAQRPGSPPPRWIHRGGGECAGRVPIGPPRVKEPGTAFGADFLLC